jgi:anti-sigma factor RsiW
MNPEELEFLLLEYLDGSLPPEQRAAVRDTIERDPETAARLQEYKKLDDLFRSEAPMPNIQWDKLAKRISGAIRRPPPTA